MEKIKIRVNSPEHSEKIQKKLFELGCEWATLSNNKKVSYVDQQYLFVGTFDENKITYSSAVADDDYFENQPHKEVELIETITYEFREIPKRNVVKVGEFSYYEDELSEALKNIKSI